jgi:hypothetical protein
MRLIVIILAAALAMGCGGASKSSNKCTAEFYRALDAGNISEAKSLLYDVTGYELYRCAEMLIEEYIAVGDIQSAISVYERNTPNHCSTYEMQYSSYSHDGYENRVTKLLYDALIEADNFERAWKYHHLEYDDPNYPGNGGCYFGYVSDVLIHLCQQGRTLEAQQFLDKHSLWFLKNVDNAEWGEKYPLYHYSNMVRELQSIINQRY